MPVTKTTKTLFSALTEPMTIFELSEKTGIHKEAVRKQIETNPQHFIKTGEKRLNKGANINRKSWVYALGDSNARLSNNLKLFYSITRNTGELTC